MKFISFSEQRENLMQNQKDKIMKTLAKHLSDRFDKTAKDISSKPTLIRRCFMTGKQCTACEKSLWADDEHTADISQQNKIFVIMPFRANLDTFYKWNLRQFLFRMLIESHKIDTETEFSEWQHNVERADQVSRIGYVMCERICRRIQESALICVDLSLRNQNVFYELGLAIGLGKPILIICDKKELSTTDEGLLNAIKIEKESIIEYPGVEKIGYPAEFAWNKIQKIEIV